MQSRRVLPPRTSRGRRPQQTQQQKQRDDLIYNQLFERVENTKQSPKKTNQRQKVLLQRPDSAQLQLQYKNMSSMNRIVYPYSRGYHYFFDLNSFPRLENSITYALDQDDVFHNTFSQDDKYIREDLTIGQLFNRHIFGLPYVQSNLIPLKTKDKNTCHHYLFQNQDRKYFTDKNIYQLQQILNNFDKLDANGEINKFSCLKKDIDLIAIIEDEISAEQKKNILRKKIKIFKQKKQSMQNILIQQDKNFFHHSLNQKLHDAIEQKQNELTFKFIMGQMEYYQHLRQNINTADENGKRNYLQKLFKYNKSDKSCINPQTEKKILLSINDQFFKKDQNDRFYTISSPFMVLSFANNSILEVCQKVLALKLVHQNQPAFFTCKIFWKKIFGRNLTINKQMKHLSRAQYDKMVTTTLIQLNKWKKQQQTKSKNPQNQLNYPALDNFIKLEVFQENSKSFDLFSMENQIQITTRQYVILALFYQLYLCIAQIHQFILNNQNLYEIIASQHFMKASNYFVESFGTVRIGILEDLLKRLAEWIMRADFQADFKLLWVYNQELGVAYIVKASPQSDWETEKQAQEDQENQQCYDSAPQKRIV